MTPLMLYNAADAIACLLLAAVLLLLVWGFSGPGNGPFAGGQT